MREDMNMSDSDVAAVAVASSVMIVYYIIVLAIAVVMLVGMWKMFQKAGKPGWAAIIPFYNTYCLCEMAMGNGLFFLLMFVPCVNVVFQVILSLKLAKAFGQGTGFGIGLFLLSPIFYMILGFGDAQYIGVPDKQ